MIKANELRIGNLVVDHKDRICRVTEIHGVESDSCNGFMAWPIDGGGITTTPHKPIPLTEEWLLKLGFEKALNGYWDASENWWVRENKLYAEPQTYLSKVDFVHELQNLYHALTGEELTIKGDAPNSL